MMKALARILLKFARANTDAHEYLANGFHGQEYLTQLGFGLGLPLSEGKLGIAQVVYGYEGVGRRSFIEFVGRVCALRVVSLDARKIITDKVFGALRLACGILGARLLRRNRRPLLIHIDNVQDITGAAYIGLLYRLAENGPRLGVVPFFATTELNPVVEAIREYASLIRVGYPSRGGYRLLLESLLHHEFNSVSQALHADDLVDSAIWFMPATLKKILRHAVALAKGDGQRQVDYKDWVRAVVEHNTGSVFYTQLKHEEKQHLAIHEAGHLVISLAAGGGTWSPFYLSTLPRGSMLGFLQEMYVGDWGQTWSRQVYCSAIMTSMAGMVAEEVFFGEPTNGGSHDLAHIKELTDAMVASGFFGLLETFGMNEDGLEESVKVLLSGLWAETQRILNESKEVLVDVAESLSSKQEMFNDDITALVGDRLDAHKEFRSDNFFIQNKAGEV